MIVIPAKCATEKMIKVVLQEDNPDPLIDCWRFLSFSKLKHGRQITIFRVDEKSATALEAGADLERVI